MSKVVAYFNANLLASRIIGAVVDGVNETARAAYDQARDDVPVRKVFRFGRDKHGLRVQGRQDVRTLSLEEALGESLLRRKLGLPSAFATSANGRRRPGSQAAVATTNFGTYRAKNRANPVGDVDSGRRDVGRIEGHNRLVNREDVIDHRGAVIGQRFTPNTINEKDLSSRGKYELTRTKVTGEKDNTLGGALRRSLHLDEAVGSGKRVKAKISAGNDEVDYAKYVEFGTRRSRAQPFLRPALARAREELAPNIRGRLARSGTDQRF
jgi:HK97 gp10 family phage protein